MKISRLITDAGHDPFVGISWRRVDVEICSADPSARVCLTDIEVPAQWSREAAETFVHYYIRRAGVPVATTRVREDDMPEFLWCSVPDTAALMALPEDQRTTHETSARQVFLRLAGMWTYWGFKAGYFDTEADARSFHDEIAAMLARQVMAPNSPQWFNTGLFWAYGLKGPAQGHFYGDHETGKLRPSANAYARPQLHACFLHSVRDELVNEGGIMHLFEREMRVFKYGSGAGANMSAIRGKGEELSSGTNALGLMRFLGIGDKAAGAIHAGGLPRRAGKMVVVDVDHPDVVQFIRWKGEEQYKIAALVTGARVMRQYLSGVMAAVSGMQGEGRYDPQQNPALKVACEKARRAMIPTSAIERVIAYAKQGYRELHIPIYATDTESDVFMTVSAHQTRQAIRVTNRFMEAVSDDEKFSLRKRTDGGVSSQPLASEVMDDLAHAAWATGEPTIQFADSIADAHTCPETDKIRASTPASEYFFIDDTACPLAAINLLSVADHKGFINIAMFAHVVKIATVMLDISVTMAQYPSRAMARRTLDTRPIGLGFANFAALITRMGYAYDSDEARATAAAISGLLTGEACAISAELAKELGAFNEFTKNRAPFLQWIAARRDLMMKNETGEALFSFESLPQNELADAMRRVWEVAYLKSEVYGTRNAQLSCVPPTSTIARIMDCDTLGLMPVARLLRSGTSKTLSPNITYGLQALGYSSAQIDDMNRYVSGHATLANAPAINHDTLRARGLGDAEIAALEEAVVGAPDLTSVFDPFVIGERFCREQLGLGNAELYDASFCLLTHLGFSREEIAAADAYVCGARTLANAPHLSLEDEAVFARDVSPEAQIALLAHAQQFLTGGIAHTVHLPHETSVETCQQLIRMAWRAGLKSLTLKRAHAALYEDMLALPEETVSADDEPVAFREAEETMAGTVSQVAAELVQQFIKNRRDLPLRRNGFTQKASIGGHKVYLCTGEYEDGALGEMFLDMPDAPENYRALLQQFARAISIAMQYGVPLAAFVDAFARAQFAPSGAVEGSTAITEASSLVDYIFRELAASYLIDAVDVRQTVSKGPYLAVKH